MGQSNYEKLPIDQVDRELQDQIGTGAGIRTPDKRIMIPLLYQLSYTGTAAEDSVSDLDCPDRPPGVDTAVVPRPLAVLRSLVDLVLPRTCRLCQAPPLSDRTLCGPCSQDLPLRSALCRRCLHQPGAPLERCPGCHHQSPLRPLIHLSQHEGTIRKLILAAKTGHKDHLAHLLAQELALLIRETTIFEQQPRKPVVLAIPRSKRRQFTHGIPLSQRIAIPLANLLGLEYHRWLGRKGSRPQVSLSASDRRRLAESSFFLHDQQRQRKRRQTRSVILVDDVRTTGATLWAATRVLERQEIAVKMWVVASVSRALRSNHI